MVAAVLLKHVFRKQTCWNRGKVVESDQNATLILRIPAPGRDIIVHQYSTEC
jgi:hypothetical protein